MSRHERAPEPGGPIDIEVHAPTRTQAATPHHRPITTCTVTAASVSYARAGRVILDRVGMQVAPGESVAVIGPSGSGKTTLLALLAGLEQPDSGTVRRQCDDRARRPGLILQGYGLVSVLTAAENIEIPLQAEAVGRRTPSEIRERAAAALESVGLTAVADHLIEELSGGQQQRVAIARALAIDPSLIIADEITAELDHQWKEHVVALVLDVARRGGVVILATHDPEIARRCNRSVYLIDGHLSG